MAAKRRTRRPPPHPPGWEPANKGARYARETLTRAELDRLLQAASSRSATGLRARALIAIGAGTGVRIREALALRPEDIDRAQSVVHVLWGKGGKRRVVGIDQWTLAHIDAWLGWRRRLNVPPRAPIYCAVKGTARGKPLTSAYVRALLPKLAARAGLEKRIHYHCLRHTAASELARTPGVTLPDIQAQLGHKRLDTTARYLDTVSPERLADVMRRRAQHVAGQPNGNGGNGNDHSK